MKRFYSMETGCTYIDGVHAVIPDDAVFITEERYKSTISNPVPGKVRGHDADGLPVLLDPPPPTKSELVENERRWRDLELLAVVWLRDRHRDQLDLGTDSTLSSDQFADLLTYIQALRDWPQSPDFPDVQHRPKAPAWIAEQAQ